MEQRIWARAVPKKVELKETYSYVQTISRTPETQIMRQEGIIKVELPFDGRDYFSRESIEDICQQLRWRSRDPLHMLQCACRFISRLLLVANPLRACKLPSAQGSAAHIGYLAFANCERSDLRKHLHQHGQGTLPLQLPLRSDGAFSGLASDQQRWTTELQYRPEAPDYLPINVELDVLDEEALDNPHERIKERLYEQMSCDIEKKAGFNSKLVVLCKVEVQLPSRRASDPLRRIKLHRFSIEWPTLTSVDGAELSIHPARAKRRPARKDVAKTAHREKPRPSAKFNPVSSCMEWSDVPMSKAHRERAIEDDDEGVDTFTSPYMRLEVGHPGELLEAAELRGHVEVHADGQALSGTQMRLFLADGREHAKPAPKHSLGRRHKRGPEPKDGHGKTKRIPAKGIGSPTVRGLGPPPAALEKHSSKTGSRSRKRREKDDTVPARAPDVEQLRRAWAAKQRRKQRAKRKQPAVLNCKTELKTDFRIVLQHLLNHRRRSPTMRMQLQDIVPNQARLEDIWQALRELQFTYDDPPVYDSSHGSICQAAIVRRAGNPEDMTLYVLILGKHYQVKHIRRAPGRAVQYATERASGEMSIQIWGEVRGDSTPLLSLMIAFQRKMHARVERTRAPS